MFARIRSAPTRRQPCSTRLGRRSMRPFNCWSIVGPQDQMPPAERRDNLWTERAATYGFLLLTALGVARAIGKYVELQGRARSRTKRCWAGRYLFPSRHWPLDSGRHPEEARDHLGIGEKLELEADIRSTLDEIDPELLDPSQLEVFQRTRYRVGKSSRCAASGGSVRCARSSRVFRRVLPPCARTSPPTPRKRRSCHVRRPAGSQKSCKLSLGRVRSYLLGFPLSNSTHILRVAHCHRPVAVQGPKGSRFRSSNRRPASNTRHHIGLAHVCSERGSGEVSLPKRCAQLVDDG